MLRKENQFVTATPTSEVNKQIKQIEVNSPLNGQQPLFAYVGYSDLMTIIGRILTIIDATIADKEQRRAIKDLIKREFWFNWCDNLDKVDTIPTGIPDED